MKKGGKIVTLLLATVLSVSTMNYCVSAKALNANSTRGISDDIITIDSYQESLLVSYELWETSAGTVTTNQVYRTYRFTSGYKELKRSYTVITDNDPSPLIEKKTKVTITYDFY